MAREKAKADAEYYKAERQAESYKVCWQRLLLTLDVHPPNLQLVPSKQLYFFAANVIVSFRHVSFFNIVFAQYWLGGMKGINPVNLMLLNHQKLS